MLERPHFFVYIFLKEWESSGNYLLTNNYFPQQKLSHNYTGLSTPLRVGKSKRYVTQGGASITYEQLISKNIKLIK